MYRLLIVDDEHHIVDWLYELFMEQQNLNLDVYKAYSVGQALSILEKSKIDVVLSDIKMPGMDGFALAEKIQQSWKSCKVIFLTGYDTFDYVYRANKTRQIGYILKTEDDDVIIAAVATAISEIEQELEKINISNLAISTQRLMGYFFERELFFDAITSGTADSFPKSMEFSNTALTYVLFGKEEKVLEKLSAQEKALQIVQLRQLASEHFLPKAKCTVFEWGKSDVVILFQATDDCADGSVYIREMLEMFSELIKRVLRLNFSFLLLEKPVKINEIWMTISRISEMFFQKFNLPTSKSKVYAMVRSAELLHPAYKNQFQKQDIDKEILALETGLEQRSIDIARRSLQNIAKITTEMDGIYHTTAIEVYQKISLCFLQYINRYCLHEVVASKISLTKLYGITAFERWNDELLFFIDLSRVIIESTGDERSWSGDHLIEKMKRYIEANLNADLTLAGIAEYTNYNPAYISRLFRQLTDCNLSDYINNARIERAKSLLQKTKDPVQAIAQAVGFESSQYFSTVFKRRVGLTPLEYRKR